jgi:hypothetical protein
MEVKDEIKEPVNLDGVGDDCMVHFYNQRK